MEGATLAASGDKGNAVRSAQLGWRKPTPVVPDDRDVPRSDEQSGFALAIRAFAFRVSNLNMMASIQAPFKEVRVQITALKAVVCS